MTDAASENSKVIRAEAESVPTTGNAMPDLDILEMPVEGVAAFWLSLKKLCDLRRGKKIMAEEAEYTAEPFIRHLLLIGLEPWPEEAVRRAAEAKAATIHEGYRRKLALMRLGLMSLTTRENPRLTLTRMHALFPAMVLDEEKLLRVAQGLMKSLADPAADRRTLLGVSTRLPPDRLMVKLLFYAVHSRRHGAQSLRELLPHAGSAAFVEGLTMILDGFDPEFVRETVQVSHEELLLDARRKMEMALEMFLAIRARLNYDQIYTLALSYIP